MDRARNHGAGDCEQAGCKQGQRPILIRTFLFEYGFIHSRQEQFLRLSRIGF